MSEANRAFVRFQWRTHRLVWNLSGGRLGRRVAGMPVLELVTIGRRSGEPRQILISYVEYESSPVLIGTNAGHSADPAWVLNLQADPSARARWDGTWRDVTARELAGADHRQVWEEAVRVNPAYADYAETLTRPVPIVLLAPR